MKCKQSRKDERVEKLMVFCERLGNDVEIILSSQKHLYFDLILKNNPEFESVYE